MNWGFSNRSKKFESRRDALIESLRKKGIEDERVLGAIAKVPRHKMVDSALEDRAYKDTALPIGKGQTISQPYTVAVQTELMQLSAGEKVLEIGTGSGYQAAILYNMGVKVYSIERIKRLYEHARSIFEELNYDIEMKLGDGTKGWRAYAPYDGIVVTAGAPSVPEALMYQLTIGGHLVVPVGDRNAQQMVRLTRTDTEDFDKETFSKFKFVPLIGEKGWK